MKHLHDMSDLMRLTTETALMLAEAQMVIAMRLAGMAGFWNVTRAETRLMQTEKVAAAQASVLAAGTALMLGAAPAAIGLAALEPLRRKTRANARRLGRRGLRLGG